MVDTGVRLSAAVAGVMVIVALVSGCGSSPSVGPSSASGASLVSATCGRCHPLSRVEGARHDRAGWTATIGRMRAHGAQLTDQQAQAVVDYLTKRDGGS